MKRDKLLTIAVVALLLLNFGTLGYLALQNKQTDDKPGGPRAERIIIDGLGFLPEQIEQFEDLKFEHRSMMQERDREQREAIQAYWELLKTANPDTIQANRLLAVWSEAERQKKQATFDHFRKIRLLCNDKQKMLFDSLIGKISNALMPPPPRNPPRP